MNNIVKIRRMDLIPDIAATLGNLKISLFFFFIGS